MRANADRQLTRAQLPPTQTERQPAEGERQPAEGERQPTQTEEQPTKYKLRYAFSQQLLQAWRPRPTLKCAISLYSVIGLVFITLGVAVLVLTQQIYELEQRYDNLGPAGPGQTLTLNLTLSRDLRAPVYFYYMLRGFHQNHRRYIKSIPTEQLRGNDLAPASLGDCEPALYNRDLHPWQQRSAGSGAPLDGAAVAIPCGAAARAYFNDSYVLLSAANVSVPISAQNITWADDRRYKFKNIDLERQWIDVTDERFINWMKIAPFSTFRKTWGVVRADLPAGDYRLQVANNWNSALFEGEKWVVLSETNAFGGRNEFLAYAYLAVGALSIMLAFIFSLRKFKRPKGITEYRLQRAEREQNGGVAGEYPPSPQAETAPLPPR